MKKKIGILAILGLLTLVAGYCTGRELMEGYFALRARQPYDLSTDERSSAVDRDHARDVKTLELEKQQSIKGF